MDTSTVDIHFEPWELESIQAHANTLGQSLSDFVRESALERVEEFIDTELYRQAREQDDGIRYSMGEVMRIVAED
ncbi:DUF6290 family protein [Actinotignum timonense]|uniref:DUF6290 family protein n=1 Tax=Actinotignum TaxID=1653174 RepID=UPI00254A175B|nr:DUF6290 family protein [Actinotignum timonense]MDK6907240.1 DUF6290 family protein [Actinotignum timonense]MDK8782559.1 DUF6290 family protein [Actinotignum timonense]MDY5138621.1 DUF6290 family protein [Actinotignum timonense]